MSHFYSTNNDNQLLLNAYLLTCNTWANGQKPMLQFSPLKIMTLHKMHKNNSSSSKDQYTVQSGKKFLWNIRAQQWILVT